MQRTVLAVFLFSLLFVVSCSSHDSSNPTDPGLNILDGTPEAVEISESGHDLLGFFDVIYDQSSGDMTAIPVRSSQWHLNALTFIENAEWGPAIQFTNVSLSDNVIDVDVSITNPFPGIPQFSGFDMKGIIIGPADMTDPIDPSCRWAGSSAALRLLNADGWIRWWNPTEFPYNGTIFSYKDSIIGTSDSANYLDATLNGYKVFATGLGSTQPLSYLLMVPPDNPNGRAVLHAGAKSTRHYKIAFSESPTGAIDFRFNFAIDTSHGLPADYVPGAYIQVPGGFPPDANQLEPFVLDVQVPKSTVFISPEGCTGGEIVLDIRVSDWQALINGTPIANEIDYIEITSPTLFIGKRSPVLVADASDGTPWATYTITLDGLSPPAINDQQILIKVVSSEGDYQPQVTSYAGSAPLATYYIVRVTVKTPLPGGQPGFILNPLSPWPKPGGTIYNSNFINTPGPDDPKIGWVVDGISVDFMPLVDPENRVYVAQHLEQGGVEVFVYDSSGMLLSNLIIDDFEPSGDPVMVGCSILWSDIQGKVIRIYQDGNNDVLFQFIGGTGPNAYCRLNLDNNGHCFVHGSTGIQAFDQYGSVSWSKYGIGSEQSMFIGPVTITSSSQVIIGELNLQEGPPGSFKFWALNSYTGQIMWSHTQDISDGLPYGCTADPVQGNIYYALTNHVFSLNSDGSERWIYHADKYLLPDMAVSHLNGMLYAAETSLGDSDTYPSLLAIAPKGILEWKFECPFGIAVGPIVDGDGMIYFAMEDGVVVCVTPDGDPAWIKYIGGQPEYLVFGPDGTLLLGVKNGLFDTTLICLSDD
jgi:hypothetical protein